MRNESSPLIAYEKFPPQNKYLASGCVGFSLPMVHNYVMSDESLGNGQAIKYLHIFISIRCSFAHFQRRREKVHVFCGLWYVG
jgi:hypothetical protein